MNWSAYVERIYAFGARWFPNCHVTSRALRAKQVMQKQAQNITRSKRWMKEKPGEIVWYFVTTGHEEYSKPMSFAELDCGEDERPPWVTLTNPMPMEQLWGTLHKELQLLPAHPPQETRTQGVRPRSKEG